MWILHRLMKFSVSYFFRYPKNYFSSVTRPVWMNILVAILRFQGPPFTYRYGFSFLLYVSGFITTEVAGTYAIFLYISWHQKELVRRDSRRKNYGVGSISFFYTTTFGSLDRINIRLKSFWTQIGSISRFGRISEYRRDFGKNCIRFTLN